MTGRTNKFIGYLVPLVNEIIGTEWVILTKGGVQVAIHYYFPLAFFFPWSFTKVIDFWRIRKERERGTERPERKTKRRGAEGRGGEKRKTKNSKI